MHDRLRHRLPDPVVAVVAGDLLDDVDLGLAVGSPRRQGDAARVAVAGHRVPDRIEEAGELVGAERGSEDPVDLGDPHVREPLRWRQGLASHVGDTSVHHQIGTRLAQQLGEPGDSPDDPIRVDTSLEPGRRLGAQAEASGGLHHAERREPGDLEGDRVRVVGDLGVEPAHHAGDADRPVVGVADQEIVGGERLHIAVERRHRLAGGRQPDPKPPPVRVGTERGEVVGVVRLVELEHHVVADVDDVADRSHPGRREAALHPNGRRADDDAGHHGRREAPAAVAGDDLDVRAPTPHRCRPAPGRARADLARGGRRDRGPRRRTPSSPDGCG